MKKHFKHLLAVLVVVLCLSTVLLAACNPDKKDPEPEDYSVATSKMLNSIVDNVSKSMCFGESFGVDVSAAFIIDDKTAANQDVAYKLTAKGNANGKNTANEDETDFVIELVKEAGENKSVLLGLAYEAIENKPYFFINLLDSGYKKINGYSLAALYKLTQSSATVSADDEDGGLDINTVINSLIPMLFGEEGTVKDNVYTLNFDLAKTVSSIIAKKNTILLALGMEESDLNALIAQYLGGLTYEQNGSTVNVEDLATLEAFFKRGMSFKGTITFTFDANNKFLNAKASFDHSYHSEDKANYTLQIDKANIGKVTTPVDSFANFKLSVDERKNAQAFNLLNFSLLGNATAYDANRNVAHNYTISVQSDIDALELLGLLEKGTSKENIVATLKKLGYFHLEINEVFDDKEPLNIMMLHSKFEEGFAVVNVHAYKAVLYEVGLGGVYDFDALIDVIGMLGEKSDEPSDPTDPIDPSEPEQSLKEKIENLINKVKEYLVYFTFDNMEEDGVTVALKDLVYKVCDVFGIDTSDMKTSMGLDAIIGCNTMNVKLQSPTFGTCTQVETDTIKCGIRNAADLATGKTDFIKEIKSLDGFSGKMFQHESDFAMFAEDVKFDKVFEITGVNLNDQEVKTSGFIMGSKGFDAERVGKQNVTLYIAIGNDMLDFAKAGFSFDDLIPLSGVLKFETEIEVLAYDANAEITVTNLKSEDQKALVGGSSAFDIIRTKTYGVATEMTIGSLGTYTMSASQVKVFDQLEGGNDVTAEVLDEDGKFTKVGEYYVRLVFGGYSANCCKVSVEDAIAVRVDGNAEQESITLGGTWNFGEYKAYSVGVDGQKTESSVAPQYRIGSTTLKSLADAFDIDGDTYTLKKNLDYVGQNFTIRFNNVTTANGQRKTVDVNIPIVSEYSKEKYGGLIYFGESLNNKASVTISGVRYGIVYKNSKWVAVSEDGAEKDITMTFEFNDTNKTPLEFAENGYIKNYPNVNKTGYRYTRVNYTISIDGYFYTYYFSAYELYTSNKSVKVGDKLDGVITNVYKIEHEIDGKSAELEFKYGAEGYAIYVKDTDTKVYDVTVTVTKDGADYTLTEGAFTEAGTYKVEYSLTVHGAEQTFFHNVTVQEA